MTSKFNDTENLSVHFDDERLCPDVNEPFTVYALCNVKLYCASNEMMKMKIFQLITERFFAVMSQNLCSKQYFLRFIVGTPNSGSV